MLHVYIHDLLRAWLKKHKRTLLITAGVIGGGVAVYHGLQSLGLIYQPQRADNSAQTTVSQEVEDCAEAQYAHRVRLLYISSFGVVCCR